MQRAFTLVELLVVITIIVILLALLTPALDKAIYQAELAQCAAKLRAIGNGAITYAMNNGRRYPQRSAAHMHGLATTGSWDDRPRLASYMPINKLMLCPLGGRVDLENDVDQSEVFGSYDLWFGFRYDLPGARGMHKLGDRMTFDNNIDAPARTVTLRLLASDRERFLGLQARSSHFDADGIQRLIQLQEQGVPEDAVGLRPTTMAYWTGNSPGPMDMNFGRDDASVERFSRVFWNEWAEDDRIARVPSLRNTGFFPGYHNQVPAR